MNLQAMLFRARSLLKDHGVRETSNALLVSLANEGLNELARMLRQAREDYFGS